MMSMARARRMVAIAAEPRDWSFASSASAARVSYLYWSASCTSLASEWGIMSVIVFMTPAFWEQTVTVSRAKLLQSFHCSTRNKSVTRCVPPAGMEHWGEMQLGHSFLGAKKPQVPRGLPGA